MERLRIPGPTPCPDEVLQAMTKQMINHRGPEFGQILNEVTAQLKEAFQTSNDVFLLTGSGTGGLEAAVVKPAHGPQWEVYGVPEEQFPSIVDPVGYGNPEEG